MTEKNSKRRSWKKWPVAVRAAIEAVNRARDIDGLSPDPLADHLGIARPGVYQWTEVPSEHALTLWRDFDLHPSVTCPSKYPKQLWENDT